MYLKHGLAGLVKTAGGGGGGGSPSATLIHSSESGSFVTTHNFSVGTLTAGDYIAFVGVEQAGRTMDSATLEGSAMTAFTSGAVAGSSISMNAFYITSLAGGGNETLSVTLDGSTSGCWCQLIKINDGTIVTTAVTDSISGTPPDLDVTFTNSADELMIVGWIHANNTSPFSSYDGLTALQAATNGAECAYGSGSGNATAGTPDTVGVNFSAAFANAACVGIRVT